ncbi:transposase [Streptomyces sp. NRRL S-455]|uniref:IS701 family transposase n=1 Tax=Streptomyces sp. NRRL S-455 TaxID=1463908 RepID=UPI0004C1FBAF|nr:transposase [Streptomyces sp. NRRL S-455]
MGAQALTSDHTSVPAFAERLFECLPRADQRRWAHAYVQGLLTAPGKKSVRRLAAAVSALPAASQSLHQFVNASPWDWMPVRAELARWAGQRLAPRACVIGQAVLRKRGAHSCGVHRRFLASSGRSVTCQVGIGMFLSSYERAVPADWRLLLPGSWAKDPERRTRARIPAEVTPRSVEQHILDLADTLFDDSRTTPLPVVADLQALGVTNSALLTHGLALRGRTFVVAVPDRLQVTVGRRLCLKPGRGEDGQGPALAASSLFESDSGPLTRLERVAPSDGHGRHVTVMSGFVRLPGVGQAGKRVDRTFRLFTVRPEAGRRPGQLWLTSLTHTRMETVLALTRTLARADESLGEMADGFGLLDFEGRSFPGWHHHMTLVSAAYAYDRLERRPTGGAGRMLVAA